MAFDAGFVSAVTFELNTILKGARIEKIYQPEKSTLLIHFHTDYGGKKLIISANASCPRVNITDGNLDNPGTPPMFCMLLRKHLTGARLTEVRQPYFERAFIFEFEARDEMGYPDPKYLVCEVMGKYSNIIFCGRDMKIISALHIVDLSTSQKRQVLPGMRYQLPPAQEKCDPLTVGKDAFYAEIIKNPNIPVGDFFMRRYKGISALISREIAYRAGYDGGRAVCECDAGILFEKFFGIVNVILYNEYTPVLIFDANGDTVEYSFTEIRQYGNGFRTEICEDFGKLTDLYFGKKLFADRIKQRSADISKLIKNIESRLIKKTEIQSRELADCAKKDEYKLCGDLITANIWRIKSGMSYAELENCYSDAAEKITVKLDERLGPSQNAQRYYKKYSKSKNAEMQLKAQMEQSRRELEYIYSIEESISRAENENDLNEIRAELSAAGYSKGRTRTSEQKKISSKPMEFITDGGYRVLCGKNNIQNDRLSTRTAEKCDYWFHVKGSHGSHVIMQCGEDEDPPENDFTQAAMIAAYYSQARGSENVAVDYTRVRNLKKPSGAKPGYITYQSNWTAYVDPDEKTVLRLRRS